MKISDLLVILNQVKEKHGNLVIQTREPVYAWGDTNCKVLILTEDIIPKEDSKKTCSILTIVTGKLSYHAFL